MTRRVVPILTENEQLRLWQGISVRGLEECWPWQWSKLTTGYGQMELRRENSRQNWATHILVYASLFRHDNTLDVMHSCDNRTCCNPIHLSQGTRQQNMEDASHKGRMGKGWDTAASIKEIQNLRLNGDSFTMIAKQLGISRSHACRLAKVRL